MNQRSLPERPRSILICHRGALVDRDGLARWLASFSTLAGIVELDETAGRTWQRIRTQIRRSGLFRFLDVLAFRLYYRFVHAKADARFEQQAVASLRDKYGEPNPAPAVLRTASVNSAECIEFLQRLRPDFAIARCKTLLKPAVFSIPAAGTYVLHPGICPEYRNAHGCFWALVQRDIERVGLTLLRIDAGVDTGPIYGYFTCAFDECAESHVRIQQRVLLDNLDALRDRLLEAISGRATRLETSGRHSATWGQPWLSAYLRWKAAARRNKTANHASLALP